GRAAAGFGFIQPLVILLTVVNIHLTNALLDGADFFVINFTAALVDTPPTQTKLIGQGRERMTDGRSRGKHAGSIVGIPVGEVLALVRAARARSAADDNLSVAIVIIQAISAPTTS